MKHLLSINHIGYAVKDINVSAQPYLKAGWTLSEIFYETVQNTKIAFLHKEGFIDIELVSSLDETPSPIDSIIKKNGNTPYHICYNVENIDEAVDDLFEEGFRPLFMPVSSNAMDNHKICYLYSSIVGLIEIVENR